jgi:hypothetical protein
MPQCLIAPQIERKKRKAEGNEKMLKGEREDQENRRRSRRKSTRQKKKKKECEAISKDKPIDQRLQCAMGIAGLCEKPKKKVKERKKAKGNEARRGRRGQTQF